jgi:CheY-like chemotaxis protein
MFGFFKPKKNKVIVPADDNEYLTSLEIAEKYRAEIKKIKIENQPFRLSGMLHILTNKISDLLQSNRQVIYYDIESDVGRYIVGDNDYTEQVLEILLKDALLLNMDSEVILKISKFKNKFLIFEVINEKGLMKKDVCTQYLDSERILQKLDQNTNAFIKAKKIVEAMNGSIVLKSGRLSGTHYTFKIPFYEDKDSKSNQEALKTFLKGKKALFIGKDKHDTKRAQYVFETYGIYIDNIKLDDFEKKRPDLGKYNMAIIRSADLSYKHVSFFKNIYKDEKSNFKIIIVHELFEDEEKIAFSKSIAHAELYSPIVIGDVEEILYQMFILKSNAVKGISNIEIFDADAFTIKGNSKIREDDLDWYRGAHIAIVEDSKVDQRVIRNILKIDGTILYCLKNGAEMLELLETEEIDIIFSDINMPVMDGLIMTKNIRAKKKWEHIPIISISSMAFDHEVEEMKVAGMNAAISKPIEVKEVYMALEKFLVMTAKIRNRELNDQKVKFLFNKEILDIDKGLKKAESEAEYQENLLETMKMLKSTREVFNKMIYDQQTVALGEFARSTLSMYEDIHATKMIGMFKELIQFVSQKQRVYLIDYIYLYQKNWKMLEKEVERYIENVQD